MTQTKRTGKRRRFTIEYSLTPNQLLEMRKRRGENFKKERKTLRVSVLELSSLTGLSRPTISRIESGTGSWCVDSELIYQNALNSLK